MCFELYQKSTNTARGTSTKKNGHRPTTAIYEVHLVRLGPKTGSTKIKKKTHPTSLAIGLKRIVLVLTE